MFAAMALVALCGCDQLGGIFGGGGEVTANNMQVGNSTAGGKDTSNGNIQVSDAGITNSRSFLAPAGNNVDDAGGKVPDAGQAFNSGMLVGRWGDFGDCSKNVIEILGDGTFRAAGGEGNWVLEGNRLIFSGNRDTITLTLQSLDANSLTAVQPDGSVGRSQRC